MTTIVNYLFRGWESTRHYFPVAVRCVQTIAAIAGPILLATVLPITTGVNPEERSTLLTTEPAGVGFLTNAAIGAAVFLGVAAHVNGMEIAIPRRFVEIPATPLENPKLKGHFVHIPQRHWTPRVKNNPNAQKSIWESQMCILDALNDYPNAAIFQEGVTEKKMESSLKKEIQAAFSEGIPQNPESWTESQKYLLTKHGAARVLYALDFISELHPAIRSEMAQEMKRKKAEEHANEISRCQPERFDRVFTQRENALIQELKRFLKKPENKRRQVVIIYGAAHDLSQYFEADSFKRLKTEKNRKPDDVPLFGQLVNQIGAAKHVKQAQATLE